MNVSSRVSCFWQSDHAHTSLWPLTSTPLFSDLYFKRRHCKRQDVSAKNIYQLHYCTVYKKEIVTSPTIKQKIKTNHQQTENCISFWPNKNSYTPHIGRQLLIAAVDHVLSTIACRYGQPRGRIVISLSLQLIDRRDDISIVLLLVSLLPHPTSSSDLEPKF